MTSVRDNSRESLLIGMLGEMASIKKSSGNDEMLLLLQVPSVCSGLVIRSSCMLRPPVYSFKIFYLPSTDQQVLLDLYTKLESNSDGSGLGL